VEEHVYHIRNMLETFRKETFHTNKEKGIHGMHHVVFIGFVVKMNKKGETN